VFLEIQGDVNAGKEIDRIKPKMQKAADGVKEQEKLLQTLGDKVGKEVKDLEEKKLQDLLSEQKVYEKSLEAFEKLKL